MIKKWYITGDTHGQNDIRVFNLLSKTKENPEDIALIILGDSGFNYYLDSGEYKRKKHVSKRGVNIYCVRGNHEERPENIDNMILVYDENVDGMVYIQKNYPLIHYFIDGGIYNINGYKVLTIGGAYSVDKYYRLQRNIKWFETEQLTQGEMDNIFYELTQNYNNETFDFVLTHTCPLSWQPTDLFLSSVNQSSVDNTMEIWLNQLKNVFNWDIWLFGHYHDDRLVRPHVEMMYHDIQNLDEIKERWSEEDPSIIAYWNKDPNYYMGK